MLQRPFENAVRLADVSSGDASIVVNKDAVAGQGVQSSSPQHAEPSQRVSASDKADANSARLDELLGSVTSLAKAVGRVLQPWWDEAQGLPPVDASVRGEGEEFDVPLLDHDRLQVIEGERNFALTWRGGAPPDALRLYRDAQAQPVMKVSGLARAYLPPHRIALSEGHCRVEISDAAGQQVSGTFEGVVSRALPEPPPASHLDALPPDARTVVLATWLASLNGGVWALESFLRIADLARAGAQPARAAGDARGG